MANCPDDNDMACYFDNLLSEDEVQQIEEHSVGCERCREIIEITSFSTCYIQRVFLPCGISGPPERSHLSNLFAREYFLLRYERTEMHNRGYPIITIDRARHS